MRAFHSIGNHRRLLAKIVFPRFNNSTLIKFVLACLVVTLTLPPVKASPSEENIWNAYAQVFAQGLRGVELRDAIAHLMKSNPPVVLIRPSNVSRQMATTLSTDEGCVGMGATAGEVFRYVSELSPQFPYNRIILPPELARSRYDFINTRPSDGKAILRKALQDQFKMIARHEMRHNLVLIVKKPDAPGLHKHVNGTSAANGNFRSNDVNMANFAQQLSRQFGVTVTDQTGLSGGFDFTLEIPTPPTPEQIRKALLDQLGLELSPSQDGNAIDFLVIEREQ